MTEQITDEDIIMKKLRLAVLCGGRSAEHEISLLSAKSILDAMDRDKYEVILIGIDKDGCWYLCDADSYLLNADDPNKIALKTSPTPLAVVPGNGKTQILNCLTNEALPQIDVAFPILHGPFGEDGTVQGLLRIIGIPFIGADILGSAVGMDKDVMKRLLRDAGLPIGKFRVIEKQFYDEINYTEIVKDLGQPVFVKPANMGSSVGVNMADSKDKFIEAVECALQYDEKVIIEEQILGREIECSVLGKDNPIASLPGEIVPQTDFYSYKAKYIDTDGAKLLVPADLPQDVVTSVQNLAIKTFKVLCCSGLARVDCFLRGEKEIIINEINTMPGFTNISMYPTLWKATGIPFSELIDRLIATAIRDTPEVRI